MLKRSKIIVYGTHICPWCQLAREFLQAHKIPFREAYVDKNARAAATMIKKSGQRHVPVIQIGDEIIIGFDEERLRKTLNVR